LGLRADKKRPRLFDCFGADADTRRMVVYRRRQRPRLNGVERIFLHGLFSCRACGSPDDVQGSCGETFVYLADSRPCGDDDKLRRVDSQCILPYGRYIHQHHARQLFRKINALVHCRALCLPRLQQLFSQRVLHAFQ
jgi:hypothetical protein